MFWIPAYAGMTMLIIFPNLLPRFFFENARECEMKEKRELNYKTSIVIIIIALFGLLSTEATAASFDCKKAVSWVEKTVCSNPELSNLDEEMAKAYHDALGSLSPAGQKETKQYQKQWLKEISQYCIKDKRQISNSATCLKISYKERITQLKKILIKFPDTVFRNVHVIHWEINEDCPYVFIKKELKYPQIENPRDKNEKYWNFLISQKVSNAFENPIDNECTDIYVGYTVNFSNKYLVSVQRIDFFYAHGTPHGYSNFSSASWLLKGNRELHASDLFDDNTGWRNKLRALAAQKLKEKEVVDGESYKIEPSELIKIVTSPDHWVILKDGLGIQFEEYDLGFRVALLIKIDWKALDPYLSKNGHSIIFE
jgi:uncharacterized protein